MAKWLIDRTIKSESFLFNAATFVAAVLALLLVKLPPEWGWAPYLAIAQSIVTMALRIIPHPTPSPEPQPFSDLLGWAAKLIRAVIDGKVPPQAANAKLTAVFGEAVAEAAKAGAAIPKDEAEALLAGPPK